MFRETCHGQVFTGSGLWFLPPALHWLKNLVCLEASPVIQRARKWLSEGFVFPGESAFGLLFVWQIVCHGPAVSIPQHPIQIFIDDTASILGDDFDPMKLWLQSFPVCFHNG
jgi:hypothetical protein